MNAWPQLRAQLKYKIERYLNIKWHAGVKNASHAIDMGIIILSGDQNIFKYMAKMVIFFRIWKYMGLQLGQSKFLFRIVWILV